MKWPKVRKSLYEMWLTTTTKPPRDGRFSAPCQFLLVSTTINGRRTMTAKRYHGPIRRLGDGDRLTPPLPTEPGITHRMPPRDTANRPGRPRPFRPHSPSAPHPDPDPA